MKQSIHFGSSLQKGIKSISALFLLSFCSFTSEAQSTIKEHIDPAKSRGYITWSPIDNAVYTVSIYEKADSVTYNHLSKISVDHNFSQLDNLLFSTPNMYYRIIAYDTKTNAVLATSNYTECTPVDSPYDLQIGNSTSEEICEKVCNGTSYAWKLIALEKFQNGVTTTEVRLEAKTAYQLWDEDLNYVPYWQPMRYTFYDNLPSNHPYKATVSGGDELYMKTAIPIGTSGLYTYLDASGSSVTSQSGFLIEKKMDRFDIFNGVTTPNPVGPGENICSTTFSGGGSWMSLFNSGYSPVVLGAPSYNWTTITPTSLSCIAAYQNGGTSGTSGDGTDPFENPGHYHHVILDTLILPAGSGSSTGGGGVLPNTWRELSSFFSGLNNIVTPGGNTVQTIFIDAVMDTSIRIDYKRDVNGNFGIKNSKGKLTPGVYRAVLQMSDYNIIPIYYEFNDVLQPAKQKDFVSVDINPNPVVNDNLSVDLYSSQTVIGQLMVFDLNGTILYNESISLPAKTDVVKSYVVDQSYPNDQLRVSFILNDGSVIQKSVIVQ